LRGQDLNLRPSGYESEGLGDEQRESTSVVGEEPPAYDPGGRTD